MSKTSGISKTSAKAASQPSAKTSPSKNNAAKGKHSTAPDPPSTDKGKVAPPPPSDDSKLSSLSRSNTLNDSFSLSNEGYGNRKVTTDSSTRLVDSLVETYTGEYSGIESHNHKSFERDTPGKLNSSYSEHGHDCPHSPHITRERFQRLDDASKQLSLARQNVERVMDKAVEARLYNEQPVSESEEKRAETEYERLTKAEGRLHRAKQTLAEKQEYRRQRKLEYQSQQHSAESALRNKFSKAGQALRDHMMDTFRPVIARDEQARNDHRHLEAAAEWHLESNSEAARLAKDSSAARDGSQKSDPESRQRKLESRIERQEFKDSVRNASATERPRLVETELRKLDETTPSPNRQALESRLNEQLSQVQLEETRSANKEDDKRRNAVDTLLETKSQRAGKAGPALHPLSEAVEDLDDDSVRKTHKKLQDMDLNSMTSMIDLERSFGRNIGEVKADLEQQIHRGGKSTTKARKTLRQLERVSRRSRLLSQADSWDALLQCIAPSGPRLGGFLGLTDGGNGPAGAAPGFQNSSGVDPAGASRLALRIARSVG